MNKKLQTFTDKFVTSGLMSILITLAFAVYNGYIGLSRTYGFGISIAVYFAFLAVARLLLFNAAKQPDLSANDVKKSTRMRFLRHSVEAALLLLIINLLLIAPITLMVMQQRDFSLGIIAAIAVAAYTTYKVYAAVSHYLRTRKTNNIAEKTLRSVNLTDALVSVLTLQNTLITANGASSDGDMQLLTIYSSFGLYVAIVAVSVVCFVRTRKYARTATNNANDIESGQKDNV